MAGKAGLATIHSMRSGVPTAGVLMAVVAATLWGLSGTFGQFLFTERGFAPEWLVATRLLVSGALLLLVSAARGFPVFAIWRTKAHVVQLLLFGILGMLGVQYTFFAAIEHANAPTATILQYTAPVMIAVWFALVNRSWPTGRVLITIVLTIIGTFLLVTGGDISTLHIAPLGIFWGLLSAVALAFYSVQPANLLVHHRSPVVVAWGMLIGGIALTPIGAPWAPSGEWDGLTWLALFVIIILGSFLAFTLYISAIRAVGPQTASLLASAEPLAATFFTVLWLRTPFGIVDALGGACIIVAVAILTAQKRNVR